MEISVFDVLGPVMIGPSSSHTAGVARLARVAAAIAAKPFSKVKVGLSGSLAKTFRGHGTDKALIAGALGLAPGSEDIRKAEEFAKQKQISFSFYGEELEWMHENSAHFTFCHSDGTESEIWGSSVGGGRILVTRIGGFETKLHAERPTMLVPHRDRPGVISEVSRVLAENGINIAVLRLSRLGKGGQANAMFIVDGVIPQQVADSVRELPHVQEVVVVDVP